MKILVAPDSFKGTLKSNQVSQIIIEELSKYMPHYEFINLPISDGGEGFLDAISIKSQRQKCKVTGPMEETVEAYFAIQGDSVIIEMAEICGLQLLTGDTLHPTEATTYGIGELIKNNLDEGYRKFTIGIGGSATNDGGSGMLAALGMRFYNERNELLKIPYLKDISSLDSSRLDSRLLDATFTIANDVTNPMAGPNGATVVFGNQKGLRNEELNLVDQQMKNLGLLYEKDSGNQILDLEGAGAAGGIGAAFMAFFDSQFIAGAKLVFQRMNFTRKLENVVCVITGEGKSDFQTLEGKAPIRVAQLATANNIPTILLSGQVSPDSLEELQHYFFKVFSVVDCMTTREQAMDNPKTYLRKTIQKLHACFDDFTV